MNVLHIQAHNTDIIFNNYESHIYIYNNMKLKLLLSPLSTKQYSYPLQWAEMDNHRSIMGRWFTWQANVPWQRHVVMNYSHPSASWKMKIIKSFILASASLCLDNLVTLEKWSHVNSLTHVDATWHPELNWINNGSVMPWVSNRIHYVSVDAFI